MVEESLKYLENEEKKEQENLKLDQEEEAQIEKMIVDSLEEEKNEFLDVDGTFLSEEEALNNILKISEK